LSRCRKQVFIPAPREVVWSLVTDVDRHPEWWPGVLEVDCDEVGPGCEYREVIKVPFGTAERLFRIDDFDDPARFHINCVNTGAFVSIDLTAAQGGTFVAAEAGMNPKTVGLKVFDPVAGRRYFDRWLDRSLEAMREVATERDVGPTRP
jgi:carbon monoxide dehydrogenase subunit G